MPPALQGTMVCGWDKTGPGLFYVDSDGTRLPNHIFSVGSGSTYAYGVLDAVRRAGSCPYDLPRSIASSSHYNSPTPSRHPGLP